MRDIRLIAPLLMLMCLCVSCIAQKEQAEREPVLYFVSAVYSGHGSALATEPYAGPVEPGDLLDALLVGPAQEGLDTPLPSGVRLLGWEWDQERKGNLRVRLSEQYGGLADISLTLADYCIVLTLSQVDGVETVEILSSGYASNYRSHALLRADEVELFDLAAEGIALPAGS